MALNSRLETDNEEARCTLVPGLDFAAPALTTGNSSCNGPRHCQREIQREREGEREGGRA